MKTLSVKLDNDIFNETEKVVSELQLSRNRYINEALNFYNKFNRRKLFRSKLQKESKLVKNDSLSILTQFEKLIDKD